MKTKNTVPVRITFAIHIAWSVQAFLACELVGLSLAIAWREWKPLETGAVIGLIVAAIVLVADSILGVLIEIAERVTDKDFDQDGNIGQIILVNKQPLETKTAAEQFESFVRQVVIDTTERRLLAQGFTDAQIGAWRDALIRAGLAEWVSSSRRHGWRLCDGVTAETVLASLVPES